MKGLVALLLCAALAVGCFAGCGQEKQPYVPTGDALSPEEETRPTTPQVTKQAMSLPYFPERSLSPYSCGDYTNRAVFSLVYQGLFAVDRDYQAWPVLCEHYQVSWDMKTYTFYPAAATFSDGTVLTAKDVAASLKAAKKSKIYRGRFGYVKDIAATEDGGVAVTLEVPYENFLLLLDVPIVKADEVSAERPLGTGPYAYEQRDEELALRRRSDWWCSGAVPVTAERIVLRRGEDPAQLRDAFEFSDLSMVSADPGSESYVDFHSDYELWDSENGIFLYLVCNKASQVLSAGEIRRNITWAIDRNALMEKYYRGFAEGTCLPASPQSPFYSTSLAGQYGYAPDRLTQAVTQAALEQTNVVLLVNSADGIRLRVARDVAAALNGCGLKVTMSELTGDAYLQALENGEFDLYLGQTKLSANMDLSAFFQPEGSLGYGGLEDPMLYSLCVESLANSGNYSTLHQRILEDGRLCPIAFRSYAIFTQRGQFSALTPARDHLFFYHLGRTAQDALTVQDEQT